MSKFDPRIKKPVERCGATGKRMFKSHEAALIFIGQCENRGGATLKRAYQCPFCGKYHVTSKS